jgi:hypothetical protein
LEIVRCSLVPTTLVADLPRLGVAASDLLQDAASSLPRRSTQVRGRSEGPLPVVLPDCTAAADEWGNESHVRCRVDAIPWRGRAPCAERGGGRVNVAKARRDRCFFYDSSRRPKIVTKEIGDFRGARSRRARRASLLRPLGGPSLRGSARRDGVCIRRA